MPHNEGQTQNEKDSACEFLAFYETARLMILANLRQIDIACRYTKQSSAQVPIVTKDIRDC